MTQPEIINRLVEIGERAQLGGLGVSVHDLESGERLGHKSDRMFHAASTFKAAILLALLKAVADGVVRGQDQLQVRNRFLGVIDGAPYRIDGERDGDAEVHRQVGRSMSLRDLAHVMITRSSNLATNLLLDFLGLEQIRGTLDAADVKGVEIRRGVEDLAAHEQGINNEASAAGLVALFEVFARPGFLPDDLRQEGLGVLLEQEFNRMIPARLPHGVKVAHKTGEISTHAHDAGIVFPPGRAPYVIAVMTESDNFERRQRAVAEISVAVFEHLTGRGG